MRNAITLMTGTTVSQAIPIAIAPILTRLYSPEDFGQLALFMTIVTLVAVIATGRYELAIMLPRSEADADQLVRLSILVTVSVSVIMLIAVLLFGSSIATLLGAQELRPWLLMVPISVLLMGSYQTFNYWLNRHRHYQTMARNRVLQSGTTGAANIAMGVSSFGATGLILGSVLGQALATAMIARPFLAKSNPHKGDVPTMADVAKTYIAYPKFLLPSHLIGAGHASIAVFFITAIFGSGATGYFSLASRLMGLPTSLVSAAIGDVFRQRATELYHQNGEFRDIWVKTFKHVAGLGILPFGLYAIVAPGLFEIVFGEEWRVAGEYARILTVQFFFNYICAALDKSALIVGANRYIFFWNLSRFLANVAGSAVAFYLDFKIESYLYLLAAINIFFYAVSMAVEYRFSLGRRTA